MLTWKDQIINLGLEMTDHYQVIANPNFNDANAAQMTHWKCHLNCAKTGQNMVVYFSMGSGHNGKPPKLADLLDCLAMDAASVEDTSFEDWAADLGYDADSRKAERTYLTCQNEAAKLLRFLGPDAYKSALYDTERL